MEDAKTKKDKEKPSGVKPEAATKDEEKGVLYVGIDLGTSRTSIASSNGIRHSTYSVVGYPKDVVSRKLLKRDVLFGDDALKNRLSLNFYRPLEKGVIKGSDGNGSYNEKEAASNLNAARDLVKHAIS